MLLQLDYQLSNIVFSWGRMLPSEAVFFVATWLIWILAAYILIIGFSWPFKQRLVFWLRVLSAAVLVFVIHTVVGWVWWRYRPFITFNFPPVIQPLFFDQSFPSNHAAVSWALGGTVWMYNKKSGLWALLGAVIISFGRVLAGVHYASDIIAGAIIGLAVSWFVTKISFKIPPISRHQKQ